MREIDDAHDAEDDGQAERHQAVDEAGQHALDQDFDVKGKTTCGSLRAMRRRRLGEEREAACSKRSLLAALPGREGAG